MCSLVAICTPTLTVSHRQVFKATPSSQHVSATYIASSKVGMRRTSPSLVTDSPMPHQNFKLSTSTSAPTLARVCALTFPDDSRVSHASAILHLGPPIVLLVHLGAFAHLFSTLSPQPSRTVARAMLYIPSATRYPARAPTHNRPYTDDSGVTSVGHRPGHLGWCETQDARVEVHVTLPGGEILSHCGHCYAARSRR